ncbi:KxYKxGKxW signal peptide domain-containing protein [Lacticaseibacillus pabuli]|uniref:KxYKxGKxW signal peptide domain-containing protein n=1 Tax=Lacticaseibacillus pabuli TaxID=3025672 RepID=A0ABY7WQR2_9LACO|nr:KxYKxGKxW signal peptide domain-containing protein [Lacticaseibacillus sp. KACC 23028]WDF82530.1 KxYKxGKxW signal peptide domain-containing protein [Lacticaseibacillus sp. KACC 23028]
MLFNEKKHFKMYKAGRRWVVAAVAVATVMSTGALSTRAAFAAEGEPTTTESQVVPTATTTPHVSADSDSDTATDMKVTTEPATTKTTAQTSTATVNTAAPAPAPTTPAPTPAPAPAPAGNTPVQKTVVKQPAIVGSSDGKTVDAPSDDPSKNVAVAQNGVSVGTWISAKGTDGKQSVSQPNYSAIDPNATDLNLNYLIGNNTTDDINNVMVQFYLPQNNVAMTPGSFKLQINPTGTFDEFLAQLNAVSGVTYLFSYTGNNAPNLTADQVRAQKNFNDLQLAGLTGVQANIAVLTAGRTIEYAIPVTIANADKVAHDKTEVAQSNIRDFGPANANGGYVVRGYFLKDVTTNPVKPTNPTDPTNPTNPTNLNNGGTTVTTPVTGGTTTPETGNTTTTPTDPDVTPVLPDTDGGSTTTTDTTDDDTPAHGVLPDTFGGSDEGSQTPSAYDDTVAQTTANRGSQRATQTVAVGHKDTTSTSMKSLANVTGSQKQATLPQTGDAHNNGLTVIGMALAGILGLFGLGYKKREN